MKNFLALFILLLTCYNTYYCNDIINKPDSNKPNNANILKTNINNQIDSNAKKNVESNFDKKENPSKVNRIVENIKANSVKEFTQISDNVVNDMADKQKKAWYPGRKKELFEDLKDKLKYVDPELTKAIKPKENPFKKDSPVDVFVYPQKKVDISASSTVISDDQLLIGFSNKRTQDNNIEKSKSSSSKAKDLLNERRLKKINLKLKKKVKKESLVTKAASLNLKPKQTTIINKNKTQNNIQEHKKIVESKKVGEVKVSKESADKKNSSIIIQPSIQLNNSPLNTSPTSQSENIKKGKTVVNNIINTSVAKKDTKPLKVDLAKKFKNISSLKKRVLKNTIMRKLKKKEKLVKEINLGKDEVEAGVKKFNASKTPQNKNLTRDENSNILSKRKIRKQVLKAFRKLNHSYSEIKDLVQHYLNL